MNKTHILKTSFAAAPKDYVYWLTRTYAERLAALEELRGEYNQWKYAEQRFQRVYRIVKRS